MHAACCIAFRHLLMNDAATGRHPLHVSGADDTAIANAVAMRHSSGQHVGDRLDSTVRMPRESRQVILWNIVAEIIQQEERVEVFCVPKTNARWRCTPAPSRVCLDLMSRLTGRM